MLSELVAHVSEFDVMQSIEFANVFEVGIFSNHLYEYGGTPPDAPLSVITALSPWIIVCAAGVGAATVSCAIVVVTDVDVEVVDVVDVDVVVVVDVVVGFTC